MLREEVREDFVLAVFGRDLAELAEIVGIHCPPAPPLPAPTPGRGSELADECAGSGVGKLDSAARRRRNERIVTARLGGASSAEVARAYGLSKRQTRRVVAEHRSGRHVVPPAVLEAMEAAVAGISRELGEIGDVAADDDDPTKRLQLCAKHIGVLDAYVSTLRNGGWLSPEAIAEAQKVDAAVYHAKVELTSTANARLRRILAEHNVDAAVIEMAVDGVVGASGLLDDS